MLHVECFHQAYYLNLVNKTVVIYVKKVLWKQEKNYQTTDEITAKIL